MSCSTCFCQRWCSVTCWQQFISLTCPCEEHDDVYYHSDLFPRDMWTQSAGGAFRSMLFLDDRRCMIESDPVWFTIRLSFIGRQSEEDEETKTLWILSPQKRKRATVTSPAAFCFLKSWDFHLEAFSEKYVLCGQKPSGHSVVCLQTDVTHWCT